MSRSNNKSYFITLESGEVIHATGDYLAKSIAERGLGTVAGIMRGPDLGEFMSTAKLGKLKQLFDEAIRLDEIAVEHVEDANGSDYANDPTGSLHVTESLQRAEAANKAAWDFLDSVSQHS